MRPRAVYLYVLAVCVGALAALALTDWTPMAELSLKGFEGWAALLAMGLLSEALAIRLDVGKKNGNSSIVFIPLLASVQLFGPASAVLLMAITGAVGEILIRKKEPIRAVFNVASVVFASAIAGWAFTLSGGSALEVGSTNAGGPQHLVQLGAFTAFALTVLAVNHITVALAIALSQQLRFVDILRDSIGHSGAKLQDLLISPIAIAVAFLYVQLDVPGILVVLLPLLFIRHAYSDMLQLRGANDDLLKVLIKAIETRDPYTSGHSLRVSHLARRIADHLGLPRATAEHVEHAALLHDIGKIEAIYTGILMKPAALSPEERATIQSHVTKGEELLRNLSSLPEVVIRSVRHHHERQDGGGYPDGLEGDEIPLGSKIIAVCDAVDAMLSDRPYRAALTIPTVMEQLRQHSGTQFDPMVVRAILSSDLLTDYADVIRASRSNGHAAPVSTIPLPLAGPRPRSRPMRPRTASAGGS